MCLRLNLRNLTGINKRTQVDCRIFCNFYYVVLTLDSTTCHAQTGKSRRKGERRNYPIFHEVGGLDKSPYNVMIMGHADLFVCNFNGSVINCWLCFGPYNNILI